MYLTLPLFRRFARDRDGVAAVEFALILPLLLLLYFGTMETASLYSVDRRVTTIAGTIGDLVSRAKTSIPQTTLTDYFQAAQGIMQPYTTSGLKQVVSVLTVAADGTATVRWSQGYNGGVAHTANAAYSLTAAPQIDLLARGGDLVVSEISYSYLPLFGMVIPTAINLAHTEYYLPRFDQPILAPS